MTLEIIKAVGSEGRVVGVDGSQTMVRADNPIFLVTIARAYLEV